MEKRVQIPDELRNYIEGPHYENSARADLLAFMVRNDLADKDGFEKLHLEYVEFHAQYEMAKRELEEKYLRPLIEGDFTWSLDFSSGEVTCVDKE